MLDSGASSINNHCTESLMLFERRQGETFCRTAIAKAIAVKEMRDSAQYAKGRWGHDTQVARIIKAAVAGGATDGWGAELVDANTAASEFLEAVGPQTIIGKLQGLRRVPAYTPIVKQSGTATAFWRGEGKAAKMSRAAFQRDRLKPLNLSCLVVFSDDLLKAETPEAEELIRRDMIRAAARLADASFIDASNAGVANEMPAAVTFGGITFAATGTLVDDLESAVGSFSGSLETAAWILHPRLALSIGLRAGGRGVAADLGARGGTLGGLPAIVSESCAIDSDGAGSITLLDADGVCLVDEGADISISQEGAVEMSDAPTSDGTTPVAASQQFVSLWQTNSSGMLLNRRVNWELARDSSVVTITGANYMTSS